MRKFLFRWVVTLLAVTTALSAHSKLITENMTKIECKLENLPVCKTAGRKQKKTLENGTVPHVQIRESTSANWSGYAVATDIANPATGSVEAVTGFWSVPQLQSVTGASGTLYSSIWVGIDGYATNSNTVEQIGTEQDWTVTGATGFQSSYAWLEVFPSPPVTLPMSVNPNDNMAAEVVYAGGDTFYFVIANLTQNEYIEMLADSPGALRNSAEWIVEAPTVDGNIAPLADFDMVFFSSCIAQMYGINGSISNPNWQFDPITMEDPNTSTVKATPSSLEFDGYIFSVTWEHE